MQYISSRHLTMPLRSIISPHLTLPEHDNTRRFCTRPLLNFSRHGSAKPTQHITARDKTMLYPGDTSNCLTSPSLDVTEQSLAGHDKTMCYFTMPRRIVTWPDLTRLTQLYQCKTQLYIVIHHLVLLCQCLGQPNDAILYLIYTWFYQTYLCLCLTVLHLTASHLTLTFQNWNYKSTDSQLIQPW